MSNVQIDDMRNKIGNYSTEQTQIRLKLRGMRNDLEQILNARVDDFDKIICFDEEVRLKIYKGELPDSAETLSLVMQLISDWYDNCTQFVEEFRFLEEKGMPVRRSEKFFECYHSAKSMLTDDSEFFTEDSLLPLEERAVKRCRANECESI
ncbi:hypothetical protein [Thalassoglobus sp.]|uniref:hypothetical protein n=1 Tax=Thalassoglobus sp. TaxID=2795869 RepID=UPI003AA83051